VLGFITSIRHHESVKDFSQVELLLADTIKTLENQTSTNFKFYIVCNKGSNIKINTTINFEIVEVDMDCPESVHVIDDESDERRRQITRKDKGSKFFFGLQAAKKDAADFVMFIDADDYINCNVAEYVNNHINDYDALIVNKGYSYSKTCEFLGDIQPFNKKCGTCNSYSLKMFDKYPLDQNFQTQEEIISAVPNELIFKFLGSHLNAEHFVESQGGKVGFFPFHAAIYLIGNGQNISKISDIIGKPVVLTESIIKDFVLNETINHSISTLPLLALYRAKYYSKPKIKRTKQFLAKIKNSF